MQSTPASRRALFHTRRHTVIVGVVPVRESAKSRSSPVRPNSARWRSTSLPTTDGSASRLVPASVFGSSRRGTPTHEHDRRADRDRPPSITLDDIAHSQGQALTTAQPDETREEHHQSVARFDGVGECENVVHRQDRSFRAVLDGGSLEVARIRPKYSVVDCGLENLTEQPVRLRCRHSTLRASTDFAVPTANALRIDLADLPRSERRFEILPEQVSVQLHRLGTEISSRVEPCLPVYAERNLASIEVERITSVEVGLHRGEPSSGTGLRVERALGRLDLARSAGG